MSSQMTTIFWNGETLAVSFPQIVRYQFHQTFSKLYRIMCTTWPTMIYHTANTVNGNFHMDAETKWFVRTHDDRSLVLILIYTSNLFPFASPFSNKFNQCELVFFLFFHLRRKWCRTKWALNICISVGVLCLVCFNILVSLHTIDHFCLKRSRTVSNLERWAEHEFFSLFFLFRSLHPSLSLSFFDAIFLSF